MGGSALSRGMSFDLSVDPGTGGLAAVVPLACAAGRGGMSPRLQLEYQSGGSNGAFGMGWRLGGILSIAIDLSEHLPRYDGTDTFAFTATGALVAAGPWDDRGTHLVRRYRARVERGFHRVEQWLEKATQRVTWRTYDARGVVTTYGSAPDGASRIANPDDPSQVFQWLPDVQCDPHGNAIRFDYAQEDGAGVDRTSASELDRFRGGAPTFAQRYPKRIRWGNRLPMTAGGDEPPGQRWCFELVFDYGDHGAARAAPDRAWEVRPDAFSTSRPGFEVRSYRLCRRLLAFHRFDDLGPDAVLVRAYELTHERRPEGSALASVQQRGFRATNGVVASKALPPVTFDYSQPRVASGFRPAPVETLESLPHGLDGPRFRWVDLYGEGLPGILVETGDAWYFRRNEGGGRFGPPAVVVERPAYPLSHVSIQDFDGDGNPDLTVVGSREAGFYEFDADVEQWRGFRPFASIPHLEAHGGRTQWLDLDGDGRAELVVGGPDRLTWFRSLGKEGFDAGREVQPLRATGPAGLIPPWRDDPALDFLFADMTGDGLIDQVLVRNGLVVYWPNLGNGRFGAPVVMDGAPWFASDAEFDPARIVLADLDGSGTTDVMYLGHGEITYWTNACGNRLLEGRTLAGLPYIDNVSSARVLDFLGDGTPCLVWSTPLANGTASLQYLPLTDGIRAGLLVGASNSMGLVRRVTYGTSAAHYLNDRARGKPWPTRLPVHCPVVEQLEFVDEIGGARSVLRYAYHDGGYDRRERRFVGFGCVEAFDTPLPTDLAAGAPPAAASCTRTFLHLGAQGTPSLARAWRGDARAFEIASHVFEGNTAMTGEELDDALASVAGHVVRQEVFAVAADGSTAPHPLQVDRFGFLVRRVQPGAVGTRASFAVLGREQVAAAYEGEPNDPRVTHTMTLESDAYGVPTATCEIAYPRRADADAADPSQRRAVATAERVRVAHVDAADRFALSVGAEREAFELPQLALPAYGAFTWSDLRPTVLAAIASPRRHDEPVASPTEARRVEWHRTRYWDDAGSALAPDGAPGWPVRVHHVEEAICSTEFVATTFATKVSPAAFRDEGRFVESDGHWWRPAETFAYGPASRFYRLEGVTRADGGRTEYAYDDDSIMVVGTVDPAGNRTRLTPDYRVMAAARSVDENDNVAETLFDPLGIPVLVTRRGEVLDDAGVARPYGLDPLASITAPLDAAPEAAIQAPAAHLQGAAEATYYDFDRWAARREPPVVVHLARAALTADGTASSPAAGDVHVAIEYLDGFGRALQQKVRVEAGSAIGRDASGALTLDPSGAPALAHAVERWLVSGHTVYNARQQVARRYEPFFSASWRYEPDVELARFGVAHVFTFDALGRETRHDRPDGAVSRAEFGAWQTRAFDENDAVAGSAYEARRAALAPGDPERLALDAARAHAGTPVVVDLDPEGRAVRTTEASGDGATRVTQTAYDGNGEVESMTDARGLVAVRYVRDMAGRVVRRQSIDSGTELALLDAFDRPVATWTAAGVRITRTFDALDRPLAVDVEEAVGWTRRVQQYLYGDDPSVSDAALRNVRGRLAQCRDESGTRTVERYTPTGEPLHVIRRVIDGTGAEVNWTDPASVDLLPEAFATRVTYDALGRPRSQTLADGSTLVHEHLRAGGLAATRLSSDDGKFAGLVVFDRAEYNARGQRAALVLGNGVAVERVFDRDTWRTRRIKAARPDKVLQDLEYTFDPVGNVVRSIDHVHEPGATGSYLSGANTSAERRFRYDGFYQLREASGRVHRAALPDDDRTDPPNAGTAKGGRRLSLNDGGQLERYTQTFDYDLAGNLTRKRHQGVAVNWTREFWVSATSNRSLPALDANGAPVTNPEQRFGDSGNCLRLPHLRHLEWDYRGLPTRAVVIDRGATGGPNDEETYLYDSDGHRVRKVTQRLVANDNVETIDTLYLDGCEIKRIRVGSTPQLERRTTYVDDESGRVAVAHRWSLDRTNRETADTARPRVDYHVTDHLGSALLQLNEAGEVVAYEEYFPFGGTAFIAGDDAREVDRRAHRFTGKERDDATGLYYFGHRYYAPWLGRWMSADPAGTVDGLNLYVYVQNNPISYVDPDGLQTRGREIAVAGPAPPSVEAAFTALPSAEQDRLRGLMRQRNFAWFYEAATGRYYFGTRSEIQARAEAVLAAGANVLRITGRPPSEAAGETDGDGGRSRSRRTADSHGEGEHRGRRRRGTAPATVPAPTPGRGSPRSAGGDPGSGTTPPADPHSRGPTGQPSDTTGTGDSNDPAATSVDPGDGSQANTPPGSGGGDGNGGGHGTTGNGPGANPASEGRGAGGGGTADGPEAVGAGDSGAGGVEGRGHGAAAGDGDAAGRGSGPPGGPGGSAQGVAGAGPGGGPNGVPGGVAGGSPSGSPGGVLGGSPNGGANGEPGTGSTTARPGNGANDAGDPNGPAGNGTGQGTSQGQRGQTPQGQGGRATQPGGERGAGGRQRATVMDRIVRVAGWWHLEFSADPNGVSGGIPGGFGSLNLGWVGQALFLALTVVDIVLTVVSLGGLAGIKAGIKAAFVAGRRLLTAAGRRIATAWARRAAVRGAATVVARKVGARAASLGSGLRRAGSLFMEWWRYGADLGGSTSGMWSRFRMFARTSIINHDWRAGRYIAGIDTAVHEGFHWVMSRVPFWWAAQRAMVRGRPVGAVLNWAEETVAYALGRASTLRLHGLVAAPLDAFRSVSDNFGGGAAGAQAVRWAAGELAVIGTGIAAYFGYRAYSNSQPPAPQPAGATP